MHYGFIPEETQKDHWQLGSGKASKKFGAAPLMPNGHGWQKYLPKKEIQKRGPLETMACTIFGTANAYETLAAFHGFDDFPRDLAERYNAVLAKITPQGGSPHQSCETFRIFGALPEHVLPFSEDIRSWEHFYFPNPMDEDFVREAQQLLTRFVLGHEWIYNGRASDKKALLKQALSRGTVCVSVNAWTLENGKYVKRGDDNHWLMLVDYVEGDHWLVYDHYEPTLKKVAWDTDFYCAKLFFLSRNATGLPPHWFDYLLWLVGKGRIKEAFALLIKKPPMPTTPAPEPPGAPVSPAEPSNRERLYNTSKASLGLELTPADAIPDEVGCVENLQAVFHKTTGTYIGKDAARYNTLALKRALDVDSRFRSVSLEEALPGDPAVCPTGMGKNPKEHGHCWIVGKRDWMSNNSKTGLWSADMTRESVVNSFVKKRGFPLYVYRYVG